MFQISRFNAALIVLVITVAVGCAASMPLVSPDKQSIGQMERILAFTWRVTPYYIHHGQGGIYGNVYGMYSAISGEIKRKKKDMLDSHVFDNFENLLVRELSQRFPGSIETLPEDKWVLKETESKKKVDTIATAMAHGYDGLLELKVKPSMNEWSYPAHSTISLKITINLIRLLDNKVLWRTSYLVQKKGYLVANNVSELAQPAVDRAIAIYDLQNSDAGPMTAGTSTPQKQDPEKTADQNATALAIEQTDTPQMGRQKSFGKQQATSNMFHDASERGGMISIDEIPSGKLTAAQIKDLFSNRMVKGTHNRRGYSFIRYFESDGTVVEESPQHGKRSGNWRAAQDSLCLMFKNGRERCGKVVKEYGKINLYGVKKRSAKAPAVTYKEFVSAKQTKVAIAVQRKDVRDAAVMKHADQARVSALKENETAPEKNTMAVIKIVASIMEAWQRNDYRKFKSYFAQDATSTGFGATLLKPFPIFSSKAEKDFSAINSAAAGPPEYKIIEQKIKIESDAATVPVMTKTMFNISGGRMTEYLERTFILKRNLNSWKVQSLQ